MPNAGENVTASPVRLGQCDPHRKLGELSAHFRTFTIVDSDFYRQLLARLEQHTQTSITPAEEVLPLMASLLTMPLPEERYPTLSLNPQQQRQQILDILVALLQEEAERQPLLAL